MYNNLIGIKPEFIQERNDKKLMIWPDVPNWLVADRELSEIIEKFDNITPIDEFIEKLGKKVADKLIEIGAVFDKNRGIEKRKNESKLEDVCVHPTLKCNLRCKTCYNSKVAPPKNELTVNEFIKFFDQTIDFMSDKCCLSILGGEPLLVPDKTLKIAEHARDLGYKWRNISTNGTLITKEFARKAKQIDLEVQVSLDGHNAETNDIYRGKGSFEKAIKGIKKLINEGTHSVLCMTYHSGNIDFLEKYFDLALDLGVNEARFAPLKYIGGGSDVSVKKLPVDQMIKRAFNMFKDNPHYLRLAGRDHFSTFAATCKLGSVTSYCGTGSRMILLDSDGEIYPCINHHLPEFRAGNIREKNFAEIWQNSSILKHLREIYLVDNRNKKCSKCVIKHWCLGGCRGETYHVTHNLRTCCIDCANIKKAVIEMFWLLSGDTSFMRTAKQLC